ncbi:probable glutamate carboxypeptidase VP8 isoform X3 [Prosopis cineraria]|uniref:probable glutamate carboxypeptidase VP8 isoform X3 n=1 Tax=Prosopis cineraria TaxID=364024 RepID=UPI00241061F3|nr:probable glutamate carboxypeptidase VP8 isoform X3 [Prosopis cineraria]
MKNLLMKSNGDEEESNDTSGFCSKALVFQRNQINGTPKGSDEPDRFDLLRNHRDAWTYGEEFGMIASFALVGQIQINLMSKDVLNIYCVVQGFGDLFASYTPQLDNIVLEENTKKEFHLSCALWKMSSFT